MPYFTVRDRRMYYADSGQGDVILFGHSFLWDGEMWRDQAAMLASRYRCIVPDLWGHGRSEAVPNSVTMAELAEDYLALMDSLGVERFSVIGLSVGGMWAARMAAAHPHRIEKLVLCDTYLGREPLFSRFKYSLMRKSIERARAVTPALADKIVPIFFSRHTLESRPELSADFRQSLLDLRPEVVPSITALAKAIFGRGDFLKELKRLRTETHVIVGAEDKARPPHEAKRMADLIPGATYSVIDKAGHIPAREQPERMNAVLGSIFLKDRLPNER